MISAAVRRRVRVCQRVTSCEYFCKSLNTDAVKGTNLSRLQYNHIGIQFIHFHRHNNLTRMFMMVHMGFVCLVEAGDLL
jgi:hypothetical protein